MGSNSWIERDFETEDLRFHIIIFFISKEEKREKETKKVDLVPFYMKLPK